MRRLGAADALLLPLLVNHLLFLALLFPATGEHVQVGSRLQLWPCSTDWRDARQSFSFPSVSSSSISLLAANASQPLDSLNPYVDLLVHPELRPPTRRQQPAAPPAATPSQQPWCMFPEPPAVAVSASVPASTTVSSHLQSSVSAGRVVPSSLLVVDSGGGAWYTNLASSGDSDQLFTALPANVSSGQLLFLIQSAANGLCMAADRSWLTFPSTPYFAGIPITGIQCPTPASLASSPSALSHPALWSYSHWDGRYHHIASSLFSAGSELCLDADSLHDCGHPSLSSLPFCNSALSASARAADLTSRLHAVEKVNYLLSNSWVGKINRLGLPELGYSECLHGVQNDGISPQSGEASSSFPSPMALSRSWDRQLVRSMARAVSDELRAKSNAISRSSDREGRGQVSRFGRIGFGGGLICWAPVVNICRDPRWGRCQESWGEDPLLTAELGNAYIDALQRGPDSRYKQAISTAKHFVVHSGPDSRPAPRDSFDVQVLQRDLLDSYSVAFRSAIQHGNVSGLMCAYSAVNGIPMCAHRELLQSLARDGWNWDGYVTSDCYAVSQIVSSHHFSNNLEEGVMLALAAGVDWTCGGEYSELYSLIQQGRLPERRIDAAVTRTLQLMIELGLLEANLAAVRYNNGDDYDTAKLELRHRELSRQAAARSIVLLENRRHALPLQVKPGLRVGVFGPCSDNFCCQRGTYDAKVVTATTYAAGLQNASVDITHPLFGIRVVSAVGCTQLQDLYWPDPTCPSNHSFPDVIAAASDVDVIIAAMGISIEQESESNDRLNLTLPGQQEALLSQLWTVSRADPLQPKPLIVALSSGSQIISGQAFAFADAVLHVGYLGGQAGAGLADVLAGKEVPASRLTEMWYKDVDTQLPPYIDYDYKQAPYGRSYRYSVAEPAYPFAYSLSYTRFQYHWQMEAAADGSAARGLSACESLSVVVNVTNVGSYGSAHVLPLFLAPASFTPPPSAATDTSYRYKLISFERIPFLAHGDSAVVRWTVTASDRAVLSPPLSFASVVQADSFTLHVGGLPSLTSAEDGAAWEQLREQHMQRGQVNADTGGELLMHAGFGYGRGCGGGVVRCLRYDFTVEGPTTKVEDCAMQTRHEKEEERVAVSPQGAVYVQ